MAVGSNPGRLYLHIGKVTLVAYVCIDTITMHFDAYK